MDPEAGLICYNILSRLFYVHRKTLFSEYGTTEKNLFPTNIKKKKLLGSFPPPILWCNCWLNMLQQQVLQEILKISYQDRITNEEVLRRANALPLADIVAQRQFRFAEHILHLPLHWPANDAMTW